MNRRGFLQSCMALAAAPAIVRADSLMRIIPTEGLLLLPEEDWDLARWVRELDAKLDRRTAIEDAARQAHARRYRARPSHNGIICHGGRA